MKFETSKRLKLGRGFHTSIFVLIIFFNSEAQSVFKKNYDYGSARSHSIIELPSKNFLTTLGGVMLLDSIGSVIHVGYFHYIPLLDVNALQNYSSNKFLFDGTTLDSCSLIPVELPMLSIIDSNGIALLQKSYKLNANCSNKTTFSNINADKGIITVGRCEYPNCERCWTGNFYSLCVDSSLALKWAKCFTNHWGGAQVVKEIPGNGFLMGLNLETAGPCVARLDSSGNVIWCKSYIRPRGYLTDCVINGDGTSIIIGYTDSADFSHSTTGQPVFDAQLFMIKLDTSGSVLWAKAFDSDWHWYIWKASIVKTRDGGYAISGTVGTALSYNPILIKTDANGDTLWTAIHGVASGVDYQATSLLQTIDGGYLLGGDAQWAGIPAWLYKTDTLGQVPCNMLSEAIYTYPIFPVDSNVVLSSIDGAVEIPITLTYATYPLRSVWDDCDVFQSVTPVMTLQPAIYPVPTNGKIIVEFSVPLSSDSWLSIYDHTGRLVYQRLLSATKAKTTIDLAPYGKGLYLVGFTEQDRVSFQKVVVE